MKNLLKTVTVIALAGVTMLLCYLFPNAVTDGAVGLELVLPEEVPGIHSYKQEVSLLERETLPPDTGMLKRIYYPATATSQEEARGLSQSVTLLLSGDDQRSLHRPQVCLRAQGWEILAEEVVMLEINGKELKVMDLHLERMQLQADNTLKKVQAHYVYTWIGSEVSTPYSMQRILISVKENMFHNRNTRWGYPSVFTYVRLEQGEPRTAAQKRAYDFYQNHGHVFLKNYR